MLMDVGGSPQPTAMIATCIEEIRASSFLFILSAPERGRIDSSWAETRFLGWPFFDEASMKPVITELFTEDELAEAFFRLTQNAAKSSEMARAIYLSLDPPGVWGFGQEILD